MDIKIGADEIILWLRKNNKAVGISNDKIGKDIFDLIENTLHGTIIGRDQDVYWDATEGRKNIGETNLPKTAAQYTIAIDALPDLFRAINGW